MLNSLKFHRNSTDYFIPNGRQFFYFGRKKIPGIGTDAFGLTKNKPALAEVICVY